MNNQFETLLNEIQEDMVAICLEYCHNHCDDVYIHIIHENDSTFVNFFFRIDGQMRMKSRLTEGKRIEPSYQSAALDGLLLNARKIISLYENTGRPVPTEFRIKYCKNKESFEAVYQYEPIKTETKTDRQISEEWFNQLNF